MQVSIFAACQQCVFSGLLPECVLVEPYAPAHSSKPNVILYVIHIMCALLIMAVVLQERPCSHGHQL